jgi:hypothetical protein
MEMFAFNSREIVQLVLALTAALMKSLCVARERLLLIAACTAIG